MLHRRLAASGHLIDTGLMSRFLAAVLGGGGKYEILRFDVGKTKRDFSDLELDVRAGTARALDAIVANLITLGCHLVEDREVTLHPAPKDGVAPTEFYSTTNHKTRVRSGGRWIDVERQRMDGMVVVRRGRAVCTLMRNLKRGDPVVCGVEGVEIFPPFEEQATESFSFMKSETSSERAVEVKARDVAKMVRAVKKAGLRVVAVPGPGVVHTGAGEALARLIKRGWFDAILSGNALAVHDVERSMFGTSLGVDLKTGVPAREGHMNHLRAINTIRAAGSLRRAVQRGVLKSGVMYECVKRDVPFVLAGSIRDDGPLPDTCMDLIQAQAEYARQLEGAGLVIVLSSMLHGIGVGNMLPSAVKLVCVDIHQSVVTKLLDRGSGHALGVVTDVSAFVHRLERELKGRA